MYRIAPAISSVQKAMTRGLSAAAGGPLGVGVHYLLSGRRRRRILLAIVVVVVALGVSAVTAVIQQPIYIANVLSHRMFGTGDPDDSGVDDKPAPDICVPPPTEAIPVTPPATYAPLPDGDGVPPEESPSSEVPPVPPPPALGVDGKVTEDALNIMSAVPDHADMSLAQGYILYRLAHPNSAFPEDWETWTHAFYAATSTLSSGVSAVDVVATMDPGADYRPYVLVSDTATYRLLRDRKVSGDSRRVAWLLKSMQRTCMYGYEEDSSAHHG